MSRLAAVVFLVLLVGSGAGFFLIVLLIVLLVVLLILFVLVFLIVLLVLHIDRSSFCHTADKNSVYGSLGKYAKKPTKKLKKVIDKPYYG